jgi:hypothetical protein
MSVLFTCALPFLFAFAAVKVAGSAWHEYRSRTEFQTAECRIQQAQLGTPGRYQMITLTLAVSTADRAWQVRRAEPYFGDGRFNVGTVRPCFYDPANPDDTILEHESVLGITVAFLVMVFVTLGAVGGAVVAVSDWRLARAMDR